MTLMNAALLFVFVCNLAFLVGAAFLLYRIVDAVDGSRQELKKSATQSIDAAEKLHLVARRVIDEMGAVNDAQTARERSATRTVAELAAQLKGLLDRLNSESVKGASASQPDPGAWQLHEDQRAKLRSELNAASAKNHQLQEEISQTQYRLKEAMVANRGLREEVSEIKGIKQSTVDQLLARAEELEAKLQLAQARAKAAEILAESNAVQLDEIKEQLSLQQDQGPTEDGKGGVDQSGLIQSQQDQIDLLAAREKSLLGRVDQMEQAFERTLAEKMFIEERFLQLDSTGPTARSVD